MKSLNILNQNAKALADLLQAHVGLKSLILNDTGLGDTAMVTLCEGISQSTDLRILDLRNNYFEEIGLGALIKSLKKIWTVTDLHLEGCKVESKEAELMASYLVDTRCKIKTISLHEAELDETKFKLVINSLKKVNYLERVSLAKNELTLADCKSIVDLCKLKPLISLCFAHCEMEVDLRGFQALARGIACPKLRYLNLAWNFLGEESMASLCHMLSRNPAIEKLLLHHNKFGAKASVQLA